MKFCKAAPSPGLEPCMRDSGLIYDDDGDEGSLKSEKVGIPDGNGVEDEIKTALRNGSYKEKRIHVSHV